MLELDAFIAACLASGDSPISFEVMSVAPDQKHLHNACLHGKRSSDQTGASDGESSRGTRTRSTKRCKTDRLAPKVPSVQYATLDDLAEAAATQERVRADESETVELNISDDEKNKMIKISAYLESYESSEIKVTTKRVSLTHLKITIHAVPGGHNSEVKPGYFPDGSRILLRERRDISALKREITIPMVLDIDREIHCVFDQSNEKLTIHLPYDGTNYDESEFVPAAAADDVTAVVAADEDVESISSSDLESNASDSSIDEDDGTDGQSESKQ
jgi:hypothetical protein